MTGKRPNQANESHRLLRFTLFSAMSLVLAACGGQGEGQSDSSSVTVPPAVTTPTPAEDVAGKSVQPLKIGFAASTYDFTDFFGQFDAGLRQGLADRGVPNDVFVSAAIDETRTDQQVTNVENLLTLGLDYLVSVPTQLEPQFDGYRRANSLGVPVIIGQFVDPIEAQDIEILAYSGSSLENAGIVAANYIVETVGRGGRILILRGVAGGAVDEGRVGKALPIFEANGVEVVSFEHADFNRVLAYDFTQQMLTAYQDIDLIYGSSSAMALGAMTAIEDMGLDVAVVGVGGILEEVQMVLEGRMLATIFRDPAAMGRGAAEAIWLHWTGQADKIQKVQSFDNIPLDSCDSIVKIYNPLLFKVAGVDFPVCKG